MHPQARCHFLRRSCIGAMEQFAEPTTTASDNDGLYDDVCKEAKGATKLSSIEYPWEPK
jgi:hypothetical protein